MNRSMRTRKWCIVGFLLLSLPWSLTAAQLHKRSREKQWPVGEGKLVISGGKLTYYYAAGSDVVIPIDIQFADITELDFSNSSRHQGSAQETQFPDWGPAIEWIGPVVAGIDLTQTDKDYVAIQWVEDNRTKGLVLEVAKKNYASLTRALHRATAQGSTLMNGSISK